MAYDPKNDPGNRTPIKWTLPSPVSSFPQDAQGRYVVTDPSFAGHSSYQAAFEAAPPGSQVVTVYKPLTGETAYSYYFPESRGGLFTELGQAQEFGTKVDAQLGRSAGESIADFTKRIDNQVAGTSTSVSPATKINQQDYFLRPGESIAAYNARIAALRGISQTPTPKTISQQDYYLRPGESISAYNARIAALRGQASPTPPASNVVGTSAQPRADIQRQRAKEALRKIEEQANRQFPQRQESPALASEKAARGMIENEILTTTDSIAALDAEFAQFAQQQTGLPEAGRIGAITEEQRNYQFRRDALVRKLNSLEQRLFFRNRNISEIQQASQTDYANAVAEYNSQFNRAMQLYSIFDKEADQEQLEAKSDLEVFSNSLATQLRSGQLTFDQIPGYKLAQLEEYEAAASVPIGSTEIVLRTLKPDEERLGTHFNPKTGNLTVFTKTSDGEYHTKVLRGGEAPTPRGKAVDPIATALANSRGVDGYADPRVYERERRNANISRDDFDRKYGDWLSPQERQRLGVSVLKVKTTGGGGGLPNFDEL